MSIDRRSNLDIISRATALEGFRDVLLMYRLALLTEARGQGVLLSFTVHFSRVRAYGKKGMAPGAIQLFRDHGISPAALQKRVEQNGSLAGALTYYANQRVGVEVAGYVTEIEMTMFPAP